MSLVGRIWNSTREVFFMMFTCSRVVRKSLLLPHSALLSTPKYLHDNHGRIHDYLRISITDRCNLRCRYCMPTDGVKLDTNRENYLTLDELKRLAAIFVMKGGVNKIRLTGGEPTVDKRCNPLLEHLNGLRDFGLREIAMTTNGLTLKRQANLLRSKGLNSVNISLDTLRESRYETLTRRKGWTLALDGLRSSLSAGFDQVKVNCVIMRGFNDDEIGDFIRLASDCPIEVRFIEFMPFLGNSWDERHLVPSRELLKLALQVRPDLEPLPQGEHATSRVYSSPSMLGSIGFISSMSDNFCSGCNRLRITSDGQFKVCLFGKEDTSLRDLLRNGANDDEILRAISVSLGRKAPKHAGADILRRDSIRPMVKIGRRFYQRPSESNTGKFTHLDADGNVAMVNVGEKPRVRRVATARGSIFVGEEVLARLKKGTIAKGNVMSLSKMAGIMGAKLTSQLIPLCHNVPLDHVRVEIEQCDESKSLRVTATTRANHTTGVEMESLTAVSVALLAIYDMCKSVNKSMIISDVRLVSKEKNETKP